MSDDDLRASIGVFNENRGCCASSTRSSGKRRGRSRPTTPTPSWRSAACMPRRSTTPCCAGCSASGDATQQQDRIRVVFEGGFCEQPPLDLIRAIGRSCYVVDDDLPDRVAMDPRGRADGRRSRCTWPTAYLDVLLQPGAARPPEAEGEHAPGADRTSERAGRHRHGGQDVRARARGAGAYTRRLDEADIPYFVS